MAHLPISNLSIPKNTALVVIDLQKGIASRQTFPHRSEKVVENAAKLAELFRSKNMPVFLVHVSANAHEMSIKFILKRIGLVRTTEEIIKAIK